MSGSNVSLLIYLMETSNWYLGQIHHLLLYKYSQHSCWVYFEGVGRSYSHHQRADQFQIAKHLLRNQSMSLYQFLLVTCPKDYLLKWFFPKYFLIWKWYSHSIHASFKIRLGLFILIIPDAEGKAVVMIVVEEVRVTRVSPLTMVIETIA